MSRIQEVIVYTNKKLIKTKSMNNFKAPENRIEYDK